MRVGVCEGQEWVGRTKVGADCFGEGDEGGRRGDCVGSCTCVGVRSCSKTVCSVSVCASEVAGCLVLASRALSTRIWVLM